MRTLPLLLLSVVAVGGCVDRSDRYPSLLPRPQERTGLAVPAPAPLPAPTPDAALDARIADLLAQVDTGERAFNSAADIAEARIAGARGTAPGTEAWLNAHVALGEANRARTPVLSALETLDSLAIERGTRGDPDYAALNIALDRAASVYHHQSERLDTLNALLGDTVTGE